MTPESEPRSYRRRRWLRRIAIALLVVAGLGAYFWHITARSRLIAEIEAAGGDYHDFDRASPMARLLGRFWNSPVPPAERRIALTSLEFDDAWLADHDDLAALPLTSVLLHRTSISREGVRQLLRAHQLHQFEAVDIPLTDDDVPLLNQQVGLNGLDVSGSLITDAGLVRLDLPQLRWIRLFGTQVTADGLCEWLPGSSVTGLTIDGRQFTPEVAETLQSLPQITSVQLYGADVTDEHLDRLSSIPTLRRVEVWESSVSREAAIALKDAHPEWMLRITLPEGSVVQMQPVRTPLPSASAGSQ